MTGKQREGFTSEPANQAVAVLTFVEALLEVDAGATWEQTASNEVVIAAANFSSLMNDAGYIAIDDTNDEIDLLPGKYLCTLNAIFVNDSATVPSELGIAVVDAAGTLVHLLVEDIGLLGDSGESTSQVPFSWSFLVDAPGPSGTLTSLSLRAVSRTSSGTLSLDASSTLVIRRLGN
jgi:hypothetical protein